MLQKKTKKNSAACYTQKAHKDAVHCKLTAKEGQQPKPKLSEPEGPTRVRDKWLLLTKLRETVCLLAFFRLCLKICLPQKKRSKEPNPPTPPIPPGGTPIRALQLRTFGQTKTKQKTA